MLTRNLNAIFHPYFFYQKGGVPGLGLTNCPQGVFFKSSDLHSLELKKACFPDNFLPRFHFCNQLEQMQFPKRILNLITVHCGLHHSIILSSLSYLAQAMMSTACKYSQGTAKLEVMVGPPGNSVSCKLFLVHYMSLIFQRRISEYLQLSSLHIFHSLYE